MPGSPNDRTGAREVWAPAVAARDLLKWALAGWEMDFTRMWTVWTEPNPGSSGRAFKFNRLHFVCSSFSHLMCSSHFNAAFRG